MHLRADYFKAAGVDAPGTWEDLVFPAEELARAGHPVGLPVGNAAETNHWLFALLASFGETAIDEHGNVTIDLAETREALDYVRELVSHMPPEALAWDRSGNDRFMIASEGSWTIDSASIFLEAKETLPNVAENLEYTLPSARPEGRFASEYAFSMGVSQWTPCPELARDLIQFLYESENLERRVEASRGHNMPLFCDLPEFDVWQADRRMAFPPQLDAFM